MPWFGFLLLVALPLAASAAEPAPAQRPQLTGQKGDAKYYVAIALAKDLVSPDQSPEEQARADAAWAKIFEPVAGRSIEFVGQDGKPSNLMLGDAIRRNQPNWQRDPVEIAWMQRARLALRERGQKFWDEFPKDVRRFTWLYQTSKPGLTVFYWRDIDEGARAFAAWLEDRSSRALSATPLDREATARWDTAYVGMRAQFLASTLIEKAAKEALRRGEFEDRIFYELQRNKIPDTVSEAEVASRWARFLADFLDFAETKPSSLDNLPGNIGHFLEEGEKFYPNLLPEVRRQYLVAAKLSSSDDLTDYAAVAALDPIELKIGEPVPGLKLTTLKNQTVDRNTWRGKVVLVDFWAFWCHSCIAAMPHLKTLYDKYHAQGFEIQSVCFAEKGETPQKILDLAKKLELPWEHALREPLRKDRLARIYSFTSLPQLMLLDRKGNLAAMNLYNHAELEAKIQELLAQPAP
jgi:thiol-disulfide isomerase/thioredoxin